MIEKIPDQIPVQTGEWRGTTFDIIPKETFGMACRKINELCDIINDITDWIKRTDETIVKYGIKPIPEKIAQGFKNLQDHRPNMVMDDPFGPHPNIYEQGSPTENAQVDEIEQAEKWIGKLCWFSQIYGYHQHIAILKRISESGLYVTDDGELHYAYCEPVKPDDPIIYKGGDNEK